MRIAEISSPDLRQSFSDLGSSSLLLSQIETLVKQTELFSPENPLPATVSSDLRRCLAQLSSLSPFPKCINLHLWKLSFRLWNACVDLFNAAAIIKSPSKKPSLDDDQHVKLRHIAADLLSLAGDVSGVPSPAAKSASFYLKTGLLWHDRRNFELALTCFEKATDLVSKINVHEISDAGERKILLDLNLARSRTAWEVSDRNLAITLLNRSKTLLFGSAEHYKALANQYLSFGKLMLSKKNEVSEALKLMSEGMNICEKGLNVAKSRSETVDLKGMRSKCLRFVAAVHLQGGEFENVLKCVRVLREEDCADQHPCLPVLATKAWLGLGKYGEAEKELRSMVVSKGVPEAVWVSAVEAYFEAAGSAGAETTKGLFLGLLGRCHVSAGAALRLVHRVVGEGGGEGSRLRAKVVAELVVEEKVVALFAGEAAAKEKTVMHGVLWNCAAEHFRSKDYETSAVMFEKSMLYVPYDMENRVVRAKGFRVLCLCFLALSQLDRAQEYINEAEKLEPNIASVFLKFKVYLQKRDYDGAINQLQSMLTCLDFTSEFLSLAAHEAVACRALPVAVASLSNLLEFYESGKTMPTTEVVVLRTLITILTQDPGNELDIRKYMKRALTRMSKLGSDTFVQGEVGKQELNWFAANSWNMGTRAGKEGKYSSCAEFFRLASEFYGAMVERDIDGSNVMVIQSLIFSVSAMLASEKQRKAVLLDSEVKQGIELLDKAGKILKSVSTDANTADNQAEWDEPKIWFIYTFSMYDLCGRLNDLVPQQLCLVKNYVASRNCKPMYLLHIGLAASEGPRPNLDVATLALNSCLSAFLTSPSPEYKNVALVIRRLVTVGVVHKGDADDDAVHGIYKQAYRIMVGLREGEYPTEEGKWLAMTAWNRAAVPVRLERIDGAKKWMNLGLEIAEKVPGMETYRACMQDFVASFEKKQLQE